MTRIRAVGRLGSAASRVRNERGQALLLVIGIGLAIAVASGVLVAYGQALGARGRYQRVADLAAISAARVMRTTYPRLFEPPVLPDGIPNPNYMSRPQYLALARAAAGSAAVRNGVTLGPGDVTFPDLFSFAPTRVRVTLRRPAKFALSRFLGRSSATVPVAAKAVAAIIPSPGAGATLAASVTDGSGAMRPAVASGDYRGPFAYRQGKPMRPDTAAAFDRLSTAAAKAGVVLSITSGFRSDAEQARLFAAHPDPRWVAPPGKSLHRLGTELDLGPPSADGWLASNAARFGFTKRYPNEPWHFGLSSLGDAPPDPPDTGADPGLPPAFVPTRWRDDIVRAAAKWNVPVELLAAQLDVESNFNPFAVSPAGARGLAQFTPGTARAYGLANPFDGSASIEAQAHLMHDLLAKYKTGALALAAYNAGAGAVDRYGGIPPFAETQGYVARILGLVGGAYGLAGGVVSDLLSIRLVQ